MSGVDFMFNQAKGAWFEKIRDGAGLQMMVLRVVGLGTDATLKDDDTITQVLTHGVEPTNAGYARKTITNGSLTITVDDTNDWTTVDAPDQTWTGVATGDNFAKVIVAEDTGADATRVPLFAYTFDITTDGSDVTAVVNVSGLARAT